MPWSRFLGSALGAAPTTGGSAAARSADVQKATPAALGESPEHWVIRLRRQSVPCSVKYF